MANNNSGRGGGEREILAIVAQSDLSRSDVSGRGGGGGGGGGGVTLSGNGCVIF